MAHALTTFVSLVLACRVSRSPKSNDHDGVLSVCAGEGFMVPYGLTIFLSAFLLFQVAADDRQVSSPPVSEEAPRSGLPVCCFSRFFFLPDTATLTGLLPGSGPGTSRPAFIVAGRLAFTASGKSIGGHGKNRESPTWSILALLFWSAGVPCFLLSSTGPLLQDWFSRSAPSASPYPLYALSNLGSLLALATYPFLIEPLLPLGIPDALLVLDLGHLRDLVRILLRRAFSIPRHPGRTELLSAGVRPRFSERALWFSLAACGVCS